MTRLQITASLISVYLFRFLHAERTTSKYCSEYCLNTKWKGLKIICSSGKKAVHLSTDITTFWSIITAPPPTCQSTDNNPAHRIKTNLHVELKITLMCLMRGSYCLINPVAIKKRWFCLKHPFKHKGCFIFSLPNIVICLVFAGDNLNVVNLDLYKNRP